MPITGDISLYFHLPFCRRKCGYCHFYVIPDNPSHQKMLSEALLLEWEQRKHLLKGLRPVSVYFGGGTPSLFSPDYLETLLKTLAEDLPIRDLEVTLEVNPEDAKPEKLRRWRKAGMNRLSIGIQTFDDAFLKLSGRGHDAATSRQAVHNAREAGFTNISVDLMYDLPGQTLPAWEETLDQTVDAEIDHLSLYNLTFEKHTSFYKNRQTLLPLLPSERASSKMFSRARKRFRQAGFEQYEISAFCRKGFRSVHNSGYWMQRSYLGFGPSAHSFYEKRRFRNRANIHRYAKNIRDKTSPVDFEETLSPEALLRESLALRLRLLDSFRLDSLEKSYGPLPESLRKEINRLIEKRLLIEHNGSLRLSSRGISFHDYVAEELI